jgi:2-polyprenyl-3-methyl-5-hydroxy-6-metoxy-1,4-benzoquinol methylase
LIVGEKEVPADIYREHIERYRFALDFVKNKKVLDMACGTGYGSQMMLEAGASEITGGDINEESIETAKRSYQNQNIKFEVADAVEMPFPVAEFDLVVSFETIEHLTEADKFVKELARVLKSKGQLIMSTPNREMTRKLMIKNNFHVKEFDREELIKLLAGYFEEIKVFGQRSVRKLTLKQKLIKKAYFIYIKIKWLEFLKRWFSVATKQIIGQEIDGLEENFQVEEIKPDREYLYFVVTGVKR